MSVDWELLAQGSRPQQGLGSLAPRRLAAVVLVSGAGDSSPWIQVLQSDLLLHKFGALCSEKGANLVALFSEAFIRRMILTTGDQ